jgi:membrane dipeptidase
MSAVIEYPPVVNAVAAPWYEDLSPALLDECLESGVSIVGCTASQIWDDSLEGMQNLQQVKEVVRNHGRAYIVTRAADIDANAGKVGVVLGLQNPKPLSDSLHLLHGFIDMGLRCSGLAFRQNSYYGCGFASPVDTGLTDLGHQAIKIMNQRGVVIDLSHAGDRTSMDAVQLSEHPVIFSHSTARSLVKAKGLGLAQGVTSDPVRRAAPEELIKAAAAKGGVICPDARTAKVADFVDQVDYLVKVAGVNHVGVAAQDDWHRSEKDARRVQPYLPGYDSIGGRKFGSDYRIHRLGGQLGPKLLYPEALSAAFSKRGYSRQDIANILSGNLLRVFKTVMA